MSGGRHGAAWRLDELEQKQKTIAERQKQRNSVKRGSAFGSGVIKLRKEGFPVSVIPRPSLQDGGSRAFWGW